MLLGSLVKEILHQLIFAALKKHFSILAHSVVPTAAYTLNVLKEFCPLAFEARTLR